jgi:MFS family permease
MRLRTERNRVLIGFAALGIFWGAWGAALPAVQRRSGASDAELGLALLLVGLGALVSMRVTGLVLDRVGPRLTPVTVAVFALAGLLPGLAGSPWELSLFLLVVGAASGAMDVAINADAVRWEVGSGRELLNLAHACFSAAVVAASIATGLLRWSGAGPPFVFAVSSALVLAAALAMRGPAPAWTPSAAAERPRFLQRVPAWLLVLGGLGALAYWIENAWQSWGAVYLERTLNASPAASALGPAVFASAMTVGRLAVHRLARPGNERRVLVAGAAVAGAGSALAAAAPSTGVALAGIVVAGAGCSVCAPTIVSVAGGAARASERATVVGSLTTLMYVGFLIGPAAVGGLAELATLRLSLGAIAALGFLLSALFAVVRLPGRERWGMRKGLSRSPACGADRPGRRRMWRRR